MKISVEKKNSTVNNVKTSCSQLVQFKKGLLISLAAMTLSACHNSGMQLQFNGSPNDSSIVNGVEVQQDSPEALATVALYFPRSANGNAISSFCTGVLISEDLVLTAGHCFADFAKEIKVSPKILQENVLIGFGLKDAKDSSDPEVVFRHVANFQVNPNYVVGSIAHATTEAMYDMTLVRLDQSAPGSAKPVQLITDASILKAGLKLTLAGFGLLSAQPMVETTKMMKVNVQVDNPSITKTQFTFKVVKGKSSCSGDSGGPAYVKLSNGDLGVIGVTSWGDKTCKHIGAYTSVPALADWIQSTSQSL